AFCRCSYVGLLIERLPRQSTKFRTVPGQIESFNLPENLILPKKPKKVGGQAEPASPESYTDQILAEYESRQKQLIKLQDIQASMNDGLVRVWEAAWTKHPDSEK
ncbi:hypothetical protein ACGYJ8_18540, partial [Sulfitobacter sp. 1A12126]|uniref:hypothetical protein n=1 Tax=Sulfitobacter sp. 1A12126 TaxID=3368591 RepID=UPI003744B89B